MRFFKYLSKKIMYKRSEQQFKPQSFTMMMTTTTAAAERKDIENEQKEKLCLFFYFQQSTTSQSCECELWWCGCLSCVTARNDFLCLFSHSYSVEFAKELSFRVNQHRVRLFNEDVCLFPCIQHLFHSSSLLYLLQAFFHSTWELFHCANKLSL